MGLLAGPPPRRVGNGRCKANGPSGRMVRTSGRSAGLCLGHCAWCRSGPDHAGRPTPAKQLRRMGAPKAAAGDLPLHWWGGQRPVGAADDCSVFAVVRVLKIGLRFAARRDNEEALSANFEKLTSGLEGPVYSVGSFVGVIWSYGFA